MDNINAVILAAGEGTRMKSKMPKVLHEVMGRPMVKRVVDTAKELGAKNICVVTGHMSETVQEALKDEDVSFCRSGKTAWHRPCRNAGRGIYKRKRRCSYSLR